MLAHDPAPAITLAFDGNHPAWEGIAADLKEADISASFFISGEDLLANPRLWQRIAAAGHEVAAHPFRTVSIDGALPLWTRQAVEEDLDELLSLWAEVLPGTQLDSCTEPGNDLTCSEGSYRDLLHERFRYVRTCESGMNRPPYIRHAIRSEAVTGEPLALALKVLKPPAWAVLRYENWEAEQSGPFSILVSWLIKERGRLAIGSLRQILEG